MLNKRFAQSEDSGKMLTKNGIKDFIKVITSLKNGEVLLKVNSKRI